MGDDARDVFEFWVDPGQATPQEVAEVFIALSELYRAHGGEGFAFRATGRYANGAVQVIATPRKPSWRKRLRALFGVTT